MFKWTLSDSKSSLLGRPLQSYNALGGCMKFTDEGSLNARMLFTCSAAWHLVWFSRGKIPRTASSSEGWDACKFTIDCRMVFAIFVVSLLLLDLRLFDPHAKMALPGLSGNPPYSMRHCTCCTLSPPIPRFNQFGKCS